MKPLDDIKFKKRLIKAWQHHPDKDIPAVWQQNMMRKVRRIGPLTKEAAPLLSFQELVWEMAPAFCILLAIIITGILSMDLSIEALINESFINDPVAVVYNGIFWG